MFHTAGVGEFVSVSSPWSSSIIGSDPGEQQNHSHPCQGLQPPGQAATPLPVQEHAEGHAGQHAQEPAGAAHPRERHRQDQEVHLSGHVPRHRHGYEIETNKKALPYLF